MANKKTQEEGTLWSQLLRRLFVGNERVLARNALEREALERFRETAEFRLLEQLHERRQEPCVEVGWTMEAEAPAEIAISDLIGVPRWTTGATGSGKSVQTMAEEAQLILPGVPFPLVHLDAKSESSRWLKELFVPWLTFTWEEDEAISFYRDYLVLDPFNPDRLPPLNILSGNEGTPHGLAAREIMMLVAENLSGVGSAFGLRMQTLLEWALRLALSVDGLSLLEVRQLILDERYRHGLLRFCGDADVRDYFIHRFDKENAATVHAVLARLDSLLLVPDTTRCLAAPGCVNLEACLESGVTILELGDAPHGAEFLGSFWLGFFVRGLARAIMGRPVTRETPGTFVVMDEWWTALGESLAQHFERLLTLARYKRVSLWLLNQLPAQIGRRYPALLATLKNSAGIQLAFRQSHEDAAALAHMFAADEHIRVPKTLDSPKYETRRARPEEIRQRRVDQLSRLPDRHFWFYYPKAGLDAVQLQATDVPFDRIRRQVDKLPGWFRDLGMGGSYSGMSRAVLDEVIRMRRAHMRAVAAGHATAGAPDFLAEPTEVVAESESRVAETATPDANADVTNPANPNKNRPPARKPDVPVPSSTPTTFIQPGASRDAEDDDPFLG